MVTMATEVLMSSCVDGKEDAWLCHALVALGAVGIHNFALLVFYRNETGCALWEAKGFSARERHPIPERSADETGQDGHRNRAGEMHSGL